MRNMVLFTMLALATPVPTAWAQEDQRREDSGVHQKDQLRIDPRLIAEATEIWSLIATEENSIWPGWNASDTPLLFYLPGEQDVLINHPNPPASFVPYEGPIRFPGGQISIRSGPTFFEWDGQNTSRDIAGVRTLVVADSLSNLRQQVRGIVNDPRPTEIPSARYQRERAEGHDSLGRREPSYRPQARPIARRPWLTGRS